MKDIVIKAADIRRELYFILACFVVAFLINVGAIIGFDRPWSEIFSQIGYVAFITTGIYVLLAMVRVLIYLIFKLFRRK